MHARIATASLSVCVGVFVAIGNDGLVLCLVTWQLIMLGRRMGAKELCERIAAVTATDIQRIMVTALQSKPAVAIYGEHEKFTGKYEDIIRALQ